MALIIPKLSFRVAKPKMLASISGTGTKFDAAINVPLRIQYLKLK